MAEVEESGSTYITQTFTHEFSEFSTFDKIYFYNFANGNN